MARAIWSGHLSFGLVNVPVGLYSATEDHTVHFHQFERGTSSRIRYKRVNEDTGKEVDYDDIVKGADIGNGKYVMLTPEELETVEPGRSRTIEINDFVDVEEIDPIFYQKTYYLAPQGEGAEKAYGLLLQAMDKAGRVGIATFVMRAKQYLAAVRPQNRVLTLETMFFADEVRDPVDEIAQLPAKQSLRKRDVDMAVSLIESMTTPWKPENYRDTYRERVQQLIKAKKNDEEIVTEREAASSEEPLDLIKALQASVDSARSHRAGNKHQTDDKLRTRRSEGRARKGSSAGGARDSKDLARMSKSELYDLAQELGVRGRSKMSHKELVAAVKKVRTRGQKKAS